MKRAPQAAALGKSQNRGRFRDQKLATESKDKGK